MTKVGTFPEPYPDELLYSVIARHHCRVGYDSPKDTLEYLFGTRNATTIFDFPSRLKVLCDRLPANCFTPDEFIDDHSQLPVFQPFLNQERLDKVRKLMMANGQSTNIHFMLGALTGTVPNPVSLKYCRTCIVEDKKIHKEAYWHRSHQFPGVSVCHKHREILVDSSATIHSRVNRHTLHALEATLKMEEIDSSALKTEVNQTDIWLAEKVNWLLMNPHQPVGWNELKERYVELLMQKGLATPLGQVRARELRTEFIDYYGNDYLEKLHCSLPEEHFTTWIFALFRKPRKGTHPLRHLLVMKFLGCEPETLLAKDFKFKEPFGPPPYPCLNPICKHYRKSGAELISITRTSETGAPVGSFACSCGFSYARSGPDQSPDDRFKRTRMIAFGHLWEKELLRLWDDSEISLRQKAIKLGVATRTVEKKVAEIQSRGQEKESSQKINLEKRDEYREKLKTTVEENPNLGPTEIRGLCKKEYIWLYRNDNDWLYDNLPEKQKRYNTGARVDWPERDNAYFQMAQDAISNILHNEEKPRRVSRSCVGEKMGKLSQILKNIDRLPRTNWLLEIATESVEEFQRRRIYWVCEQMREEGEALKSWKVVRRGRLPESKIEWVTKEIERYEKLTFM